MIPLSLQVRNFICYRENVPRLTFEGMHVVCLSGDNGNGKSALLDAITWGLWGKARARDDELIHYGKTEMEVEFEFEFGGNQYRVIRKRSLKAGPKRVQSVPVLEFQVYNQGKYEAISGNSIQDTQRKIIDVLRMDYETFVNSAFLRQGRADEFTVKDPGERKKVLADILGLSYYDELESRAREAAKKCEQELRELASAIREIDAQVARRPDYEKELQQIQGEVTLLETAVRALESETNALESRRGELEMTRRQSLDLQARIEQSRRELVEIQSQAAEHRRRIAEFEKSLSSGEEIEKRYAGLVQFRNENEDLAKRLSELMSLKERENSLDRAVAEAYSALIAEKKVCLSSISAQEQRARTLPVLQSELGRCAEQLKALEGLGAERDGQREQMQSCRSQIELLKVTNNQLGADMRSLKEKIEILSGARANCPLCDSDLGPSGRDRIVGQFTAEGQRMGEAYRENVSRAKELEARAHSSAQRVAEVEKRLQERESLQRRTATVEKSIADAREAEVQLAALQQQLDRLVERIDGARYAEAERVALEEVRARVRRLGYDAERHRQVRAAISELPRCEEEMRRLDTARAQIGEAREALDRAVKAEERWQKALAEDRGAFDAAAIRIREFPEVERKIRDARLRLDEHLGRQSEARRRLGRAEQMLNHCQYLDRQRADKTRAQQGLAEEKSICDELALAFGKKGIQAMIIDSAIPEIEEEANALLSRMTDNRLHVSLETQREAKSKDGVIETLDIKIFDELGPRSYETYSGGEAFRVNFALRIALSKLLARRAGAKLQTLVIDEGFGTQDAFGRDRLVEAINTISEDFDRIIVITHIQELKDAFPTRIEVFKDQDGSQLVVV